MPNAAQFAESKLAISERRAKLALAMPSAALFDEVQLSDYIKIPHFLHRISIIRKLRDFFE